MARTEPQTIVVVYDGQVLRPEGPLDLEVNARYRVTIAPVRQVVPPIEPAGDRETLWDFLDRYAGSVEMPPDWAAEHDHYLYGTPKRYQAPDSGRGTIDTVAQASGLFEQAITWLRENYRYEQFFAERDIVWKIQARLIGQIDDQRLPFRVYNDYRMQPGQRADLAILDASEIVLVAAELKYEPAHDRSGKDIPQTKFPVVFWSGAGSVAKDVERVRLFVDLGLARVAYSLFIDEGGAFRHRPTHPGSEWIDWEPRSYSSRRVSVLWSKVSSQTSQHE